MILIQSPLEQFEVVNLISFNAPLFGYLNLSLTNFSLYSILVFILVIGMHLLFRSSNFIGNNLDTKLIPSSWNIALESSYASINSIVREQIGLRNEIYLPFIYSLFFFIIISNLIGNIPYSFTITTSIILSVGLGFTIFIGVTIIALFKHGLHFFSFFIPGGTPLGLVPLLVLIEVISYLARSLSLGVRLFANMMSGHTLLKILSTFLYQLFTSSILVAIFTLIPFAIFTALVGLEVAVSIIQAYVFILLTSSYLKDAIELH